MPYLTAICGANQAKGEGLDVLSLYFFMEAINIDYMHKL
jgi:hypothetical protein